MPVPVPELCWDRARRRTVFPRTMQLQRPIHPLLSADSGLCHGDRAGDSRRTINSRSRGDTLTSLIVTVIVFVITV